MTSSALSNYFLIWQPYLAGNKISSLQELHKLQKISVLDLRFNNLTTRKALFELIGHNSPLDLDPSGNPVHGKDGVNQLQKAISDLPQLVYLNKQPIKKYEGKEGGS